MTLKSSASLAIVDYGLGNLFSVRQACARAGMIAIVTSEPADIAAAQAAVLPGVGAFGDAMAALRRLDLVSPILDLAAAGRPVIGICLGLQLLMRESGEFGHHRGLGLFEGDVARFAPADRSGAVVKVPQVGWNHVDVPAGRTAAAWLGTPLSDLPAGAFMYFVHSYYVRPEDPGVVLSETTYGDQTFCSSARKGNVFACQFHPERSGPHGLQIYRTMATFIAAADRTKESSNVR